MLICSANTYIVQWDGFHHFVLLCRVHLIKMPVGDKNCSIFYFVETVYLSIIKAIQILKAIPLVTHTKILINIERVEQHNDCTLNVSTWLLKFYINLQYMFTSHFNQYLK